MSEDYETGYGKPPKKHQFQKGQSGNPKGRKKGTKNLRTDLEEELNESIALTEGGEPKKVSKQRAILKATVAKAIKGDVRATQTILNLMADVLGNEDTKTEAPLAKDEEGLLELLAERALRTKQGETDDQNDDDSWLD